MTRPVVGAPALGWAFPVATLSSAALAISLAFAVPAGVAGASHPQSETIRVTTANVPHVGTVLTTSAGLTLYRFTEDRAGMSTCTGACAKVWPPFLAAKGAHLDAPHGVKGLSLIDVGDGHWQVAFHDVVLYRFEGDSKKGQAKGQGVGGTWFAVLKSGIPSASVGASATASSGSSTPSTAPSSSTTQPVTPTTQPALTQTPATQAPPPMTTPTPTTPPTTPPPPTTTPTTAPPPTTTPTTSGGGYGY